MGARAVPRFSRTSPSTSSFTAPPGSFFSKGISRARRRSGTSSTQVDAKLGKDGEKALVMADHEGDFVSELRKLIGVPPSAMAIGAAGDPGVRPRGGLRDGPRHAENRRQRRPRAGRGLLSRSVVFGHGDTDLRKGPRARRRVRRGDDSRLQGRGGAHLRETLSRSRIDGRRFARHAAHASRRRSPSSSGPISFRSDGRSRPGST